MKSNRAPSSGNKFFIATTRILSCNPFFYIILAITILQGVWYALSFKPGIFDEGTHFGLTNIYTNHLSPFISTQSPAWDRFGNITRNPNYLFYYLMSWPLRLIKAFTHSEAIQVLGLRLIMLACFLAGLYFFKRLLIRLGSSRSVAHTTLLLLVLTPALAPFAGALNYDIPIFLITPITFLWAMDILESRGTNFPKIVLFILLGVLGSLVMFSYLALYAPLFLFLLYKIIKQSDKQWLERIKRSAGSISRFKRALLILGLVVAIGLFIERPVYNLYRYHNISPSCTKLMSEQRCLKNYTAARDIKLSSTKPSKFKPVNPVRFTLAYWLPGLWATAVKVAPSSEELPILQFLFGLSAIVSIGLILVYLRDFLSKRHFPVIITISFIYALFLLADDYSGYRRVGQPVAIVIRYLLPILPIFIYLALESVKGLFGKHRAALLTLASIVVIVLITQGGSIGSATLTTELHHDYWQKTSVLNTNSKITTFFHKIIFERSVF